MSYRTSTRPVLLRAVAEMPSSPRVLLVALVLAGLAASLVLARSATGSLELRPGIGWTAPSGVFRAPHPSVIAPGRPSAGQS